MRKRLLLLSFLTATAVGMYADQFEILVVKLKNGTETEFFLKDKPQVRFEGTDLKVTSSLGDTSFALADVLRFTYTKREGTGIDEIIDNKKGIGIQDGVLVISQLEAGTNVSIYSLDGKLLRQSNAQHAGTFRLSLSELPSGIYLVKIDNVTYKITKR